MQSNYSPMVINNQAVTPENFLKILTGENMNGTGSGKTIQRYCIYVLDYVNTQLTNQISSNLI